MFAPGPMKRLRGMLSIIRPEDCAISSIAVWVGLAVSSRRLVPSRPLPLLMWGLSTFFLVAALNILNDMGDLEIDRMIHEKRALASGRISLRLTERYLLGVILASLLFAFIGAMVGKSALPMLIYIIGLGLGLLYEIKLKRLGFLGNIAIAVLFAFPLLLGGSLERITLLLVILCSMAVVNGLAKEVINDVKDLEGDRGKRPTLPQWIGVKPSLSIAGTLIMATVGMSILPLTFVGWSISYIILISICDAILLSVIVLSFRRPMLAHNVHSLGMLASLPAFLSLSI